MMAAAGVLNTSATDAFCFLSLAGALALVGFSSIRARFVMLSNDEVSMRAGRRSCKMHRPSEYGHDLRAQFLHDRTVRHLLQQLS